MIQELQAQIAGLRDQLKAQNQTQRASSPSGDGEQPLVTGSGGIIPQFAKYQPSTMRRSNLDLSRQPEKSGPVFRHLGRLVCPEDGVDQFAGSSTGVHFTLSAQSKYQSVMSSQETFPEAVFSLYLLTSYPVHNQLNPAIPQVHKTSLHDMFPLSQAHYYGEIEVFFNTWSTM